MSGRVYLDHNATTPLCAAAAAAVWAWLETGRVANPSSVHGEGRAAQDALATAREQVAAAIGARPRDVIFTSGATEANVLALSAAGGPVATSAIEHPSVRDTLGDRAVVAPVDGDGRVDLDSVGRALAGASLCSVILANNEIGVVQDAAALKALCERHGALLHLDAAQAFGKVPLDVRALGADLVTLSAHKIGGLPGAGALWARQGVRVRPVLTGGHQERGRRAGTEALVPLVAFGAAAEEVPARLDAMAALRGLKDALKARLTEAGARVNGADDLPNTLSLRFDGVDGEALLMGLDLAGFAVSAGSACTAGSLEPSHVLLALGLDEERARSSIRVSLGPETTAADAGAFATTLLDLLPRLREVA